MPALRALPRASLTDVGEGTPVERSGAAAALWVKRDDLSAPGLGGNKVRALEYLLAGVGPGTTVLTVGGTGSTHALSTVLHAKRLHARTVVLRWRQELNDAARAVGAYIVREADVVRDSRTVSGVFLDAARVRLAHRLRGAPLRWVPAGGTTPLGILGHVNAALELAAQVERGALPAPARVVLPLGTGGTAAGLALGFALAGLRTRVLAVRVVPRVVARRRRILSLAERTARLIERIARDAGQPVTIPRPAADAVHVDQLHYGGAYGRETHAGREAMTRFAGSHPGCCLDATYSAKAFAAALAACDGQPTLFWLTFDGRWMGQLDSLTA